MRLLFSNWRNVKRRWRQHFERRQEFFFGRRLHSELLEDRHLLAVITVDTLTDEADGSITDGDVSLRDAIAVAADGDTIDFDAVLDGGTILLTLGELPITRSMTIDASSLSSGFTIDASGNDPTPDEDNGDGSRIFNIDDGDRNTDSNVTLSGLTLTGGDVDGDGGAVATAETLRVTDSTISGNSAGGNGGGIYSYFKDVTMTSSTISGNSAGKSGGGIFAYDGNVTVTSTTISGNSASGSGGGIYAFIVTMTSSTISENSAGDDGGGIYGYDGATMTSSTISENSAGDDGGGIHVFMGEATVTSSTISGNSAGDGGGIYSGYYSTVTSSTISGNSADGSGGGVFVGKNVTMTFSTMSENSAGRFGGGIFAGYSVRVTSSTISGNSAGSGGGIDGYVVNVTSSTISGNSARDDGGGIEGSLVNVTSSTISGNSAGDDGGGIISNNSATSTVNKTVTSSTISGNSAGDDGGGIHGNSGTTVTDSTISGNSAGDDGGGIYDYDVSVRSSTISGNAAVFRGGGVFSGTSGRDLMTVNSSTITGNSADAGGGIYAYSDTTINNSIVAGNSDLDLALGLSTSLTAANSLIGDNTGSGFSEAPVGMPDENGNLVGDPNGTGIIDPLLSPLGNFGGSTQTHALLPGSPAINVGDPDFAAPPDHDQRGTPFVRVSGGRIDMGAFEAQIAPVDFNNDDQLDCADVDALVAAIVAGNNPPEFDLTSDILVDQADLAVWLTLAGLKNLPSHDAYLLGDANLDGKVDATDLNEIGLNWLQDVTGWCSSDFTADGVVNSSDLNKVGLNWLQDVSVEAAANQRVPRAPLANRVVAPIATAPKNSVWFIAASEPKSKFSPDDRPVKSGAEYISSSRFAKRSIRRDLRSSSTRVDSRAHDVNQTQVIGKDELVDLVLRRW